MVRCESTNQVVTAYICGEIDHHIAPQILFEIDRNIEIYRPSLLIMDFSAVSFMDSSGVGLIMGRYRKMQLVGGSVEILNPSSRMEKILKMAGLDRLVHIRKEKENEDNK